MADKRYCVECGYELQEGDVFCPSCGARVPEDEPVPEAGAAVTYKAEPVRADKSGTLNIAMILTLVWSTLALIVGVYFAVNAGPFTDYLVETLQNTDMGGGKTGWDVFVEQGLTAADLKASLVLMGGLLAASGACGLVAAFMMYRRTNFLVCFILLLACVILSGIGIVSLIVGLIVLYLLYTCKPAFAS